MATNHRQKLEQMILYVNLTAKQMSDEEHGTAAWHATRAGELIKPELSFVEDPGTRIPLSDEERKRAYAAAERFRARAQA